MKLHSGYLISLVFLMRVINTTLIVIMPTLPKNIYTISKIFVNVDALPDTPTERPTVLYADAASYIEFIKS